MYNTFNLFYLSKQEVCIIKLTLNQTLIDCHWYEYMDERSVRRHSEIEFSHQLQCTRYLVCGRRRQLLKLAELSALWHKGNPSRDWSSSCVVHVFHFVKSKSVCFTVESQPLHVICLEIGDCPSVFTSIVTTFFLSYPDQCQGLRGMQKLIYWVFNSVLPRVHHWETSHQHLPVLTNAQWGGYFLMLCLTERSQVNGGQFIYIRVWSSCMPWLPIWWYYEVKLII